MENTASVFDSLLRI